MKIEVTLWESERPIGNDKLARVEESTCFSTC